MTHGKYPGPVFFFWAVAHLMNVSGNFLGEDFPDENHHHLG